MRLTSNVRGHIAPRALLRARRARHARATPRSERDHCRHLAGLALARALQCAARAAGHCGGGANLTVGT